MWAELRTRTHNFPQAKARVVRLKELDDAELDDNIRGWKGSTIRGNGPSIYDAYPRFIEQTRSDMHRCVDVWILAERAAGSGQTHETELLGNLGQTSSPWWRRWGRQ